MLETLQVNAAKSSEALPEIELRPAEPRDAEQWDAIVDSHPEARFCHLWGYRRPLEEAYGLKCVYLKIYQDSTLAGIFPSVAIRRLSGRYLLSQPFNEYGGPLCASEDCSRLAPLLLQHAEERGCGSVLIRGGLGCQPLADSEYCSAQLLQSYGTISLTPPDTVWKKALTHKARTSVKQAWNSGLRAETRVGPRAIEGEFFDLYLRSMKRLCVPPHSREFFGALGRGLGERLVASWVWHDRDLAAVLLGGATGRRVHCIIIASNERYWSSRPNDLANWQMVEWAASKGIQSIDWGSASSPEELRFKQKWGAVLLPYSHYRIARCHPEIDSAPRNRRYVLGKLLWRKLVPVSATGVIGPILRRYFV